MGNQVDAAHTFYTQNVKGRISGYEGTYKFDGFEPEGCLDTNDCNPHLKVLDLWSTSHARTYEDWE